MEVLAMNCVAKCYCYLKKMNTKLRKNFSLALQHTWRVNISICAVVVMSVVFPKVEIKGIRKGKISLPSYISL